MGTQPLIRIIGDNGQISLGKKFAGKMVSIDQIDSGTWMIKAGEFIPDSQAWLYKDGNLEKMERAIEWASKTPPQDNFDEWLKNIGMSNDQSTPRSE